MQFPQKNISAAEAAEIITTSAILGKEVPEWNITALRAVILEEISLLPEGDEALVPLGFGLYFADQVVNRINIREGNDPLEASEEEVSARQRAENAVQQYMAAQKISRRK